MSQDKIKSRREIALIAEDLQGQGERVVFTNGCLDILHAGHVQYVEEGKGQGEVQIVGLNSDDSIRRLKGETRPVVPEEERAIVLAALACVDYVVIFEEDTPYELIRDIQPDVLVKGGDWQASEIVGSDIVLAKGGEVRSLPFRAGVSTTAIVTRLMGRSQY